MAFAGRRIEIGAAVENALRRADEAEFILQHSRRVIEAIRSGDHLKGEERDTHVIGRLRDLEASY